MRSSFLAAGLALAHSVSAQSSSTSSATAQTTVDSTRFATTEEVKHLTNQICKGGLRLPGTEVQLKTVEFIKSQLAGIPGLKIAESYFELASWVPDGGSLYSAGRLKIGMDRIDIASTMSYSRPTNGSYVSGQLMYVPSNVTLSSVNMTGKIILRDYALLPIPEDFIASGAYYVAPGAQATGGVYTRPFISSPDTELIAASNAGAAGYISMFNISREQLESYYGPHAGVFWNIPGLFTGAEQYSTLVQAAAAGKTASIRIDATTGQARVPRVFATLPGTSNETIVIASHTDGVTYVQENGPVALLTLARYFASLPKSARNKTIMFAFESSHLAFQKDSDKLLARAINATYETNDVSMVIALEHLGSREILPSPATDGSPGNVLNYTGKGEAILWSVGPVQNAITEVVKVAGDRKLDNTIVSPGFPPANPNAVPLYQSMGGLGTYYHTALIPTMALISGPWSLWAPSFGIDAIDYDRLRLQHMAIGDVVIALSKYSKSQLAGNYTMYRQQRAAGAKTNNINIVDSQYIVNGTVDMGSVV